MNTEENDLEKLYSHKWVIYSVSRVRINKAVELNPQDKYKREK